MHFKLLMAMFCYFFTCDNKITIDKDCNWIPKMVGKKADTQSRRIKGDVKKYAISHVYFPYLKHSIVLQN